MRKVIVFIIAIVVAACQGKEHQNNTEKAEKNHGNEFEVKNQQYFKANNYAFSVSYPQNWHAEEYQIESGQTIINLFPEIHRSDLDLPVIIHAEADASFIGIYPDGYGTELPMGKSEKLSASENPAGIKINENESQKFLLENGKVWAYYLVPADAPQSWDPYGFIFAQIGVDNPKQRCFDKESGRELSMEDCDPMMGDTIKRYGSIKKDEAADMKNILQQMKFISEQDNNQKFAEEIRIEQPEKNAVITSPLLIKGEAKGSWFFEAEFPIHLIKDGETISQAIAKAEGNWMTSDFVPFSANMEFSEIPSGENAYLLLKNNNASGKPELDKSYKIPVKLGKP
ncbi:MAG: Gmad2 immunoglobulin-like domain-containing protein [Bacteroidota bacterium]